MKPTYESIRWVCWVRELGSIVFGFLPGIKMFLSLKLDPAHASLRELQSKSEISISNSHGFVGRGDPGCSAVSARSSQPRHFSNGRTE